METYPYSITFLRNCPLKEVLESDYVTTTNLSKDSLLDEQVSQLGVRSCNHNQFWLSALLIRNA
jgi:hypothetical protein